MSYISFSYMSSLMRKICIEVPPLKVPATMVVPLSLVKLL